MLSLFNRISRAQDKPPRRDGRGVANLLTGCWDAKVDLETGTARDRGTLAFGVRSTPNL